MAAVEVQRSQPVLYGLDKELAAKAEAKFDPQLAANLLKWLEGLIGEKLPQDFYEALRSGLVLCKAANAIRPGVIEKINDKPINGSVALMERDNIKLYLAACQKLGVPANDMFIVADLHDGKYLLSVMQNLLALRERQKVEGKLRDAIAQRKARRLAIDEDTLLETMADLLLKRDKGVVDAAALRAQIAVFKGQRIKTCGHLLKLYRRKEYWSQLPLNEAVRRSLEDVMFDLDLDTPLPIPLAPSSYTIESDGSVISAVPQASRKRKSTASEATALVPPNEEQEGGCQCVIV